jgi:hypothetical protein
MSLAGRTVSGPETKELSPQEQVAYFRRQAAASPLGKYWQALERGSEAESRSEASSTADAQHQTTLK